MQLVSITMFRHFSIPALLALIVALLASSALASTVAPPENLGELARSSDVVVFAELESANTEWAGDTPHTVFEFRTLERVDGDLEGSLFEVRQLGGEVGKIGLRVSGAPSFQTGERYLLFLDHGERGPLRTRALSYGVLRQDPETGHLAPLPEARELALLSEQPFEPVVVYDKEELLRHLVEVRRGAPWNASAVRVARATPLRQEISTGTGNCRYLTAQYPIRWFGFEDGSESVSIIPTTPGQVGITDGGVGSVDDGAAAWTDYDAAKIDLTSTATASRSIDCSDGSAFEFGNPQVIFNDPCGEMSGLSTCSGTLAIGGSFYSTQTALHDGLAWHRALSPAVVVNNGAQCVGETTFRAMMTHELGHTLGFGHHTDTDATMYGFVQGDGRGSAIKGTDKTCAVYAYHSFYDVPLSHPFWAEIEAIETAGVTQGCGGGNFCPGSAVNRAQMAIFLVRAVYGPGYTPPAATGVFSDVATGSFAAPYIEKIYADGITTGCGVNPLRYCPGDTVNRAQMAAFLIRALYGAGYSPPAPSGVFADVGLSHPLADYIEKLYADGITSGCGVAPLRYCPATDVTRAQMAAFLSRAFGLPLP